MKNQAQGMVSLYLVKNTDMDEEEFHRKFHEGNIIAPKLQFVTSDGEVHTIDLADLMNLEWTTFQNNEEENKEKATKQEIA